MRKRGVTILIAWLAWCVALAGCAIDHHLEKTIKVDDPFAVENERDFLGMVTTYFALPEGESTLVRFPNGKKLLIDTGSPNDGKALLALLRERRVTKLDYVLLTNDQPEHCGGFAALAETMQIDTVIMPRLTAQSIRRIVPLARVSKTMLLSEADEIFFDQQIVMTVLHPSEPLFLSPQDNSLVFQLRQGQLRFLFTSGIGEAAEERLLLRRTNMLRAEVLKVASQGSNQASSQPFLGKVDPQVAVFETGRKRDQWGIGEEEVLERLSESWAETYITSQHGTITILSNGNDYKVFKGKKQSRG